MLQRLVTSGIFADEGEGGDKGGDKKVPPVADDKSKDKQDDDKSKDKSSPVARIDELVSQRNEARRQVATFETEVKTLKQQIEQLKSNDGKEQVVALQKEIADLRESYNKVEDEFDALLETQLQDLPQTARDAVKAIPGTPRDRYRWFVNNRALMGEGAVTKEGRPAGPSNDKRPPSGDSDKEASGVAKGYVEARKPAKTPGYSGLV